MKLKQEKLAGFRQRKDEHYREDLASPIEDSERPNFAGLEYYPFNESLALELEVVRTGPGLGDQVNLICSDGRTKHFLRYGVVRFEVAGESAHLSILSELDNGGLFLPFMDATNGIETYEVGRFLEPQLKPNGLLSVDFNYAYNPYCAFSDGWSCPVPPAENHLSVRIEAGEKGRPQGTH